jgi:hypothetical protein
MCLSASALLSSGGPSLVAAVAYIVMAIKAGNTRLAVKWIRLEGVSRVMTSAPQFLGVDEVG